MQNRVLGRHASRHAGSRQQQQQHGGGACRPLHSSTSSSSSSSRAARGAARAAAAAAASSSSSAAPAVEEQQQQQEEEEDLMQFPDRHKWYEAKFAADDMPDWTPARLLRAEQQAPGVRLLALEIEASRERVPLRNAYVAAGQAAVLRVNGGEARRGAPASAPPAGDINTAPLFLLKGDIFAGETKSQREPTSVLTELQLLVAREEAPDLYDASPDDLLSLGPFEGTGLDTRTSAVLAVFRYPTIVMFVAGHAGAAAAAALIESPIDAPTHLSLPLRSACVVYYLAPNRGALCLADRFERWEEEYNVRVVVTTKGFSDAWDGDDELVYDPEATAAFVLTGGDVEAEEAALEVCKEAEIEAIVRDSQPAPAPVYTDTTPKDFERWMKKKDAPQVSNGNGNGAPGGPEASEELTD